MLKIFIAISSGLFICLIVYSIRNIGNDVPKEKRDYMDPLTTKMKIVWPFVNFIAYHSKPFFSQQRIESTKLKLKRAELSYLMNPYQLFGLQITIGIICALITYCVIVYFKVGSIFYSICSFILGYYLPLLSANDRRKIREKSIIRDLPVYLDFFVMSLEAGLNMSGAIQQAVEKGPSGALNNELNFAQRDIRAGMNRMNALKKMAAHINLKEINNLVTSLAQAEKSGGSITETLRIQSDQRRMERFNKAEKLALEAPVKLIFPLVSFIFPCTFIVLFFPIILKFMAET